ncbi:MAG: hypothetical protein P8X90_17450 [Desulfobacterales bacterium]
MKSKEPRPGFRPRGLAARREDRALVSAREWSRPSKNQWSDGVME